MKINQMNHQKCKHNCYKYILTPLCKQSQKSRKEKEDDEGKKASGEPGSDLGNLTPRAFVIVYIWPHWHDNGGLWTC